jgi:hypothetical protein
MKWRVFSVEIAEIETYPVGEAKAFGARRRGMLVMVRAFSFMLDE